MRAALKSPVMRVMLFLAVAFAAHSQSPAVNAIGVGNAANRISPVGPGFLVSLYGSSLASGLALPDSVPLSVPTIDVGGVVNGASFQPGIVPGSWLTIKGSNLSPVASDTWDKAIVNGNLPTSLDGVSVNVGSKPAFVYFISPGQINVQAPDVGTGPVPVIVTTPGGTSVAVTANVVAQSPAFFLW